MSWFKENLGLLKGFSPLFLGLGVYRAWITVFLANCAPGLSAVASGQNIFDVAMVVTLLLFARRARVLPSILFSRHVRLVGCALLVLATCLGLAAGLLPAQPAFAAAGTAGATVALIVGVIATLIGGCAIAATILQWSELYSTLGPVRVCLHYAASLLTCTLVLFVYDGFRESWQPAIACLLPLVTTLMLSLSARNQLDAGVRPVTAWVEFSFPWRPVAFVTLYAFAFGMEQGLFESAMPGSHGSIGTAACCLIVIVAILFRGRRLEFSGIYGSLLPFMATLFLALPATGLGNGWLAGTCASWGYAANEVFVMTMIASIVYRYGANALWLFGIERGVRAIALMGGRLASLALGACSIPVAPLAITAIIVAAFLASGQTKLDSPWGVSLVNADNKDELGVGTGAAGIANASGRGVGEGSGEGRVGDDDPSLPVLSRHALGVRCAELAREHALSLREEEVLLLLAQRKTTADLERELVIANGTAKAHTRHVYSKLGIHSREELYALVGVDAPPTTPGDHGEGDGHLADDPGVIGLESEIGAGPEVR